MRTITETQYRKIISKFNDSVDKETSAMITVLSSWGRKFEVSEMWQDAARRKNEFEKLFGKNRYFN